MAKSADNTKSKIASKGPHPFRRAVLRGLGIVLPPLLTIILFIWAWKTIENSVLKPVESSARNVIVWWIEDVHDTIPDDAVIGRDTDSQIVEFESSDTGRVYRPLEGGQWIPAQHISEYSKIKRKSEPVPAEADEFYDRFVEQKYLQRSTVIPIFLCGFILVLYLLGKLFAAGVGKIAFTSFEGLIQRIPIIRNVYSSVKQVTDFVFSDQEIEFNRVVAVEYPRKGIWSIGFVTGESMLDIRSAANEPVLSVLMPTSPMPATGFTVTVKKSETIDLDITIDQAIQFVVSCGVVVPMRQQYAADGTSRITTAVIEHGGSAELPSGNGQHSENNGAGKTKESGRASEDAADSSDSSRG